jgi:hypothetical protein
VDFPENLQCSKLVIVSGPAKQKSGKRKKFVAPVSSSSSEYSDDSDVDDPDPRKELAGNDTSSEQVGREPQAKIPKKAKPLWSQEELKNLRKNFRYLDTIDDSILSRLTFKEMVAMGGKKDKNSKYLTEKLAENYERVRSFGVEIQAGMDYCTGTAHESRFLRGYVGNSQELWIQARRKIGLTGLDPISNYETVSIGLNGLLSSRVWHEVHSPSSKMLSIRMLTNSAMKTAWVGAEKTGESKEFESMQELRMAVVALDGCIRKVMPWNQSFATVAIFLHTVNFGEAELAGKPDRLPFLADFIDEILAYNAQAWDEERHFMAAQEVAAKWSALFLRRYSEAPKKSGGPAGGGKKFEKDPKGGERRKFPPGTCKLFQTGECSHTGDKHSAPWDAEYVLRHQCAKWLDGKRRWCFGGHSLKDHK